MTEPTVVAPELSAPTGLDRSQLIADERRAILDREVERALRKGARLESRSDFTAVVVYGRRVNHLLHAILSLLLFGLWLIVWILLAITGGEKRRVISVDEQGRVSETGA